MSARSICKALTILAAAALGFAGYWSARLTWADALFRANTSDSVKRATQMDSGNASYHAWLAEMQEHDGLDPGPELERALKLNPSDSAVWIRRGLRAESERDFTRAEQSLLEAAALDRLFAPRWALANYYARRGDTERFWPWARQAFEMGYGDLSPLFRLCWSLSDDPAEILARAIPPQREVLGKYLAFLTREERLEAAVPVARSLIAQARPVDTALALAYCDRLIERKRAAAALAVWNALCARGLVSLSPLDPDRGLALTNGDFRSEPLQWAFDWRIPAEAEISVTRSESPAAVRFQLSGQQPEHCELLSQFIPLTPGKKYTLRFDGKSSRAPSGVRWRVGELAESPEFAGDDWTLQQITFASGSASLARLTLVYDRAPGSVRSEGEIWLRNASIVLAK